MFQNAKIKIQNFKYSRLSIYDIDEFQMIKLLLKFVT